MKKSYLISFCNNKKNINQGKGYIGKLTVDTNTHEVLFDNLYLKLPDGINGNGITGMCHHNNDIALLLQRMPSTLLYLNEHLEVLEYKPLNNIKGVHTILSHDECIYLSVTNQDKIIKLEPSGDVVTVWSKNTEIDSIHLNSICVHDNQIYATAFGLKQKNLWSSAQSGYVFNVKKNENVIENLWHPHSLVSFEGSLYCCDSSNQNVINQKKEILLSLPGYARGLFFDKDLIICGSSQGRLVSHSTGEKISNKSDNGILAGVCGISVHFKDKNKTVFTNLDAFATEIFDVIPI